MLPNLRVLLAAVAVASNLLQNHILVIGVYLRESLELLQVHRPHLQVVLVAGLVFHYLIHNQLAIIRKINYAGIEHQLQFTETLVVDGYGNQHKDKLLAFALKVF